jgi:hypothetical protein
MVPRLLIVLLLPTLIPMLVPVTDAVDRTLIVSPFLLIRKIGAVAGVDARALIRDGALQVTVALFPVAGEQSAGRRRRTARMPRIREAGIASGRE